MPRGFAPRRSVPAAPVAVSGYPRVNIGPCYASGCGLIRDSRLILMHADLGSAAKLGAITETVDQLAPPPGPAAR
jgi:hypothetical protein